MILHEESLIRCALAGLNLLLVGGDSRPNAIENLESKLGLEEAIHCPTRKSDASARRFVSKLYTPRLALVVCARGLTRSQHGSDLHDWCRELKIPLLNCNHLPHPDALIAAIVKARLVGQVLRRCEMLKGSVTKSRNVRTSHRT